MKNIRNFCIISHIDHGKSTLADRLLELTGTVEARKMHAQYLDTMELEQERGITIKMQPVRMEYTYQGEKYILNLIDTPGHVDFSYEVSRALAAVEGAILLVDATKGIQAQTLSNLQFAKDQDLTIIPCVNKIDLPAAQVNEAKLEIAELLGSDPDEVLELSGKTGENVEKLLQKIIETIPAPEPITAKDKSTRALIFDSKFDSFKGVVAYVRVFEGTFKQAQGIYLVNQGISGEILELGTLHPQLVSCEEISEGEIGYIATGIKEADKVRVGDTIANAKSTPLEGYKEPRPMVFASFYPEDADEYADLKDAFSKLKLQDAALFFEDEHSMVLGRGFRAGFLGMLHMEIISERLKREFDLDVVITSPTVVFKIIHRGTNKEETIYTPSDLPKDRAYSIQEPWVKLEIMFPPDQLGSVMDLLKEIRGEFGETTYLGQQKILVEHNAPLQEIIAGFFDKLKSVSSGYASMNYSFLEFRAADLGELEVLVAGEKIEGLSQMVFAPHAHRFGKRIVEKLKKSMPRENFSVSLQAQFRGKIVARADLSALRKDVTAKLYGGDVTRKNKLLEKQKKGKKRMKRFGKVKIPAEVFLKLLRS